MLGNPRDRREEFREKCLIEEGNWKNMNHIYLYNTCKLGNVVKRNRHLTAIATLYCLRQYVPKRHLIEEIKSLT